MKRSRLVAAAAAGVGGVVALLVGLFSLQGESMSSPATESSTTPPTTIDRAEIEKRARLKLPERVRDLQVEVISGGMDDAIYLRFEVPTEELPGLVSGAGLTEPLSSTRRFVRDYTGSKLSWWKPDEIDPFQSGNLIRDSEPPRYALSLLASSADAPWQTVYVFVTGL